MIYGHNRTIHGTEHLDVEVDQHGKVVAVWFRCMALPFEQVKASEDRAVEMEGMYAGLHIKKLVAVEVL